MQKPRLREERGQVWGTQNQDEGLLAPHPRSCPALLCELTLLPSRITSCVFAYLHVLTQHKA